MSVNDLTLSLMTLGRESFAVAAKVRRIFFVTKFVTCYSLAWLALPGRQLSLNRNIHKDAEEKPNQKLVNGYATDLWAMPCIRFTRTYRYI